MLDIVDHSVNNAASDSVHIREIRLARPPVNALDGELLQRLLDAISMAQDLQALVICGQPGVFSAGLDVPAMLGLDRAGLVEVFSRLWHVQHAIATAPMPVIFGLTGHCPAGGTVLAIHGDYRVMAQNSLGAGEFRLGLNEVQVGLFPGPVIAGAFRRLVGGHASQLLTRGALIDPAAALRIGLVDEVCDATGCATRALEVAREFCALPREPMLRTRELTRRDLIELFGKPVERDANARQFAEMGARMWQEPATVERLKKLFKRKAAH
jgi:Delta3-Delta2-enoyl-CoA isomerase